MLVGREGELVVLTSALDAVRGGEGRVLMLGGEPGIGKTRLVTELTRLAGEREIPTLVGRTLQEETAPALWPWWEALLGRPELDLLDDIASGDEIYSVARLRAFEKVLTTLSSSACGQGLVVVLEDLQWADEATLKLLCQGVGKPWLTLVGTYRTNERPAALRNALTALDRTGSAVLLRPRAWSAKEVALAAAAAHPSWHPVLYRESGGNPLFVLELLSSLREAALAAELTRREREVLGLLSGGRSNREIAGELVLSERTVETHVANVLGKIGLANRSQAAAWAARNQIT
jgi:DNA-binding CsgD family transcriptional regulator